MNFAVDNKHFHATIENMEGGKMMRSFLTILNNINSLTIFPKQIFGYV